MKLDFFSRLRLFDVLECVSVLNRDNGIMFTNTDRLDAIASLLRNSAYKRVKTEGLFHLYSVKSIDEINESVIIVSTHVDCERSITKCFFSRIDQYMMLGTFDNAITNAAIVYNMLQGKLPENVLIAFTGDEEEGGRGDGTLGVGHHHPGQNPKVAAAVQLGGVHQVFGDGVEVAHQEERGEGRGHLGEDDARVAVQPPQRRHQQVHGDHGHHHGHEEAGAHEGQEQLLAGVAELGDGVGREDGDDDLQHRLDDGGDDAVEVIPPEGDHLEDLGEVLPLPGGGDPPRRVGVHVRLGLEGGEDHPHEGEEHEQSADGEHDEHVPLVAVQVLAADAHGLDIGRLTHSPRPFSHPWRSGSGSR